MSKLNFIQILLASLMLLGVQSQIAYAEDSQSETRIPITVYKSPSCGCCSKWVSHLQDNGFEVNTINRNDMNSVKSKLGFPRELASCHTAIAGKYIIEGHVPAADIKRLLEEQPDVAGLTVPGMPMGSPGMEGARQDAYNVLTFTEGGEIRVFSRH